MLFVSWLLSSVGFLLLALSMRRHVFAITGQASGAGQRALNGFPGWICLCLSLYPCVLSWGGEIGTVVWLGLLTPSAMLASLCVSQCPRLSRGIFRLTPTGQCFAAIEPVPVTGFPVPYRAA